jgi:hypothetical protein
VEFPSETSLCVLHVSANVSDDHEHEDDCDIEALMEFTKVQEQIISMYTSLREEKKNLERKEDVEKLDVKDSEEKVKVEKVTCKRGWQLLS